MNDSTRRALRSGYHLLLAIVTITPLLALHVGTGGVLGGLVAGLLLVSKVVNTLEDSGRIPSWLKGDNDVTTTTEADSAPVEPESSGHVDDVPPPAPAADSTPAAPEGDAAP